MNEERIQQVMEIEKQAQEIHDGALREAEQLIKQRPIRDANLIEKAQVECPGRGRDRL